MDIAKDTERSVDEEILKSCENKAAETSLSNVEDSISLRAQKSRADVMIGCSNLTEKEGKDCMFLGRTSEVSNNVEVGSQSMLNHRILDYVDQEKRLDSGEAAKEDTVKGCISSLREKGDFGHRSASNKTIDECAHLLETSDNKEAHETVLQSQSQIMAPDQPGDKESILLEKRITEDVNEFLVVRAEIIKEFQPIADVLKEESDVLSDISANIEHITVNIPHLNIEVTEKDTNLKRFALLKEEVDRSVNLCSKSLVSDFLSFKKFFEENDNQEILLEEITSQAQQLKSILESAEDLPENLKCLVLDHLEVCFNSGSHWLEKMVKSKQLAGCRQMMNKSYVSLKYSGVSKVKSIVENISKSMQEPLADTEVNSSNPFLVTVTEVVDPGKFFIVRLSEKGNLAGMLSELEKNACSYPIPVEITSGTVYAVCNNGRNWFRGSCREQSGKGSVGNNPPEILYEFFMIDQGHHERIPVSAIRTLPQELTVPNFARECTLNHNFQSAWSIQAIAIFKQMTRQSAMNMKVFSERGGVLEVDLSQLISFGESANIASVRDALFLSHRPSSTEPPKRKFNPKYSNVELAQLKHFSVIVSSAECPFSIYVQMLDEALIAYRQMKQELQDAMAHSKTPSNFMDIQKGLICAVKHHEKWYRCLVEDVYQQTFKAFDVDTGYRQNVNCSECFNLPERFLDLPAQAIRCLLDGVGPLNPPKHFAKKNLHVEALSVLSSYREARGVVFVQNWKEGEIGRCGSELAASVILYKDGESASLNNILTIKKCVSSTKNFFHAEHGVIRSNLATQRRISRSTSINSVVSELNVRSRDASVISSTQIENNNFSLPSNTKESNDQGEFSRGESESSPSTPVSFGKPGYLSLAENVFSANTTLDDQESIAYGVSSSLENNSLLVDEAANNVIESNFVPSDYIPHSWLNIKSKLGNALTCESMENYLLTSMSQTPPEELSVASNSGCHFAQNALTNFTSRMPLQSPLQPNILTTVSDVMDKSEIANIAGRGSSGASFVEPNVDSVMGTQGTQLDSETKIRVSFVWIDSPEAIFFRTADMQRQFEELRYQMKTHYGENAKKFKRNFDLGLRCVVKIYNSWWRAEVVCMDDFPNCNVYLFDSGYHRVVDKKQIYPLDPEFDEIERLVLKCSLFCVCPGTRDGKWKDEAVDYVHDRLLGSEGISIVKRGPELICYSFPVTCLYVYDLEDGPLQIAGFYRINLNEELVEKGLANHSSKPLLTLQQFPIIHVWKPSKWNFSVGDVFWGMVTWIGLKGDIYLYNSKEGNKLMEITKWLNESYDGTEPSHADLDCRPGDLCIARYKLDKNWSRAIVRGYDENPGSVTVFFVDYGTLDSVDCRDIRLKIMLGDLPTFAICCKLFNIRPPGGTLDWPEETLNFIHKEIVDKECRVLVKSEKRGSGGGLPLKVELLNLNGTYISAMLVQKNLAELIDPSFKKKSKKKRYNKK